MQKVSHLCSLNQELRNDLVATVFIQGESGIEEHNPCEAEQVISKPLIKAPATSVETMGVPGTGAPLYFW